MSKGKKNTKLPSAGGGGWEEALVKEEVADNSWNFYMLFIASEHFCANEHLSILKQAIEKGRRKKFILFDKEAILQKANEDLKSGASGARTGGGAKSKAGSAMQDQPMYAEVCEQVVNATSSGEGVPVPLLARFIKYCLLKRKKADLSTEALNKDGATLGADANSAKKAATGVGKSTKKGKATPAIEEVTIPLPQKLPTTMKKRGEDDDDVQYIDDEPDVGPQSYIILTGFTEAELIQELSLINVNVHCVMKLLSENIAKEVSDEEATKIKMQSDSLLEFWSSLTEICSNAKILQNVAMIDILAPRKTIPTNDIEKELYGTELFDIVAQKIYELLSLHTQYKHYIGFLNVLNVPFITDLQAFSTPSEKWQEVDNKEKSSSHPPSATERPSIPRDLRYYNQLMSCIPEESSDIGLILYCLVEQVSLNLLDQSSGCSKNTLTRSEQLCNAKLQEKLNILIGDLALTTTDKKELFSSTTATEKLTSVGNHCVLSSHDLLRQKVYHLRNSNEIDIHSSSTHALESLWLMKVVRAIRRHVKTHSLDDASINALDNFCITENISQSLLQHTLTSISLEYMRTPTASLIPHHLFHLQSLIFDHPFLLKVKDNNICYETLQPSVFAPVESYCVQEYVDEFGIVQQLQKLIQATHPYLNFFHHKHLKSAVLVAHTGYDGKPLHQYSWLAQSHYPMGFQEYIQYVAKSFGDVVDKAVALEAERIAAEAAQIQQKEEIVQQEIPSDSPLQKSAKSSSTGKKSKTEVSIASSKDLSSAEPPKLESEGVKKLFNAYDLDGSPLLCRGIVRTAFTADGSQIRTESVEFISKPKTLSASVLDGGSKITMNIALGKKVQKNAKGAEKITEGDTTKGDALPPATPALLSNIPQPINNIISCGLQASFEGSITVSLSHYGPDGNGGFPVKPELPKILREANSATSSRPQSQATPPQSQKLSKKQLEQQQQMLEDQKRLEEQRKKAQAEYAEKWNALAVQCRYQQLYASNPCGLHIHCQVFSGMHSNLTSANEADGIVVRQCYHCKGNGMQDSEQVLLQAAYQEHHRCYLPDGSVICFTEKSIVIQNADGSSVRTANLHEHEQYTKILSSHAKIRKNQTQAQEVTDRMTSATSAVSFASDITRGDDVTMDKSLWVVTTAAGERFFWKDPLSTIPAKPEDGKPNETAENCVSDDDTNETASKLLLVKLNPIRVCRATDPVTKEEIITREDNTVILYHSNGSRISEFADGTRITTVSQNGGNPAEIVTECPGYARIQYTFPSNTCSVTFPDLSTVECNTDGSYCIRKADNYVFQINKDGTASYVNLTQNAKQKYNFSQTGITDVLQYCDSKGNTFNVDSNGQISTQNERISIPIHPNFLPLYCWIPGDAPPYILLPESTLQQTISEEENLGSLLIRDTNPFDCSISSTTLLKPCTTGLTQNYQVPYTRETLLPVNVQGPQLISTRRKNTPPCKTLLYRHFASRAPVNKATQQEVFQGIAKYISWRETQETTSNSVLPDMKEDENELQSVQALESKWQNEVPASMLNADALFRKYTESMMPKPAIKSESLEIVLPKAQKRKSEQIDDVRKLLHENKHPPYFSLYQPDVNRSTQQPSFSDVGGKKLKPQLDIHETEVSNTYMPPAHTAASGPTNVVQQSPIQLESKLKENVTTFTSTAGGTEYGQKGLGLIPEEVNFGVINIPGVYNQTVNVRNNSIKPARIKVKQLHSTNEMKLKYAHGPIAPGMLRGISVELTISENTNAIPDDCMLKISSETATLFVPVKATILLK